MDKVLVALTIAAVLTAGCLSYTIDNFAGDVQDALFGKTAVRTPVPPTPEPTATPVPTPTPKPTPLPTQAPHTIPGVVGTNEITIVYGRFAPVAVWVRAGVTVTWENQDGRLHSVRADDGSFDSLNIAAGQSWSRVFDVPGKWGYHDGLASAGSGVVYVEG